MNTPDPTSSPLLQLKGGESAKFPAIGNIRFTEVHGEADSPQEPERVGECDGVLQSSDQHHRHAPTVSEIDQAQLAKGWEEVVANPPAAPLESQAAWDTQRKSAAIGVPGQVGKYDGRKTARKPQRSPSRKTERK